MDTNLQKLFNLEVFKKKVPDLKPGMTVRVHQRIQEGDKQRVQIFEGLVLKINAGYGVEKNYVVRKVVEGIGVEKIFPLYSPNVVKIEIKKQAKVRRAKLYYMRDLFGKSARLKETHLTGEIYEGMVEEEKVEKEEAVISESPVQPEQVEEAGEDQVSSVQSEQVEQSEQSEPNQEEVVTPEEEKK